MHSDAAAIRRSGARRTYFPLCPELTVRFRGMYLLQVYLPPVHCPPAWSTVVVTATSVLVTRATGLLAAQRWTVTQWTCSARLASAPPTAWTRADATTAPRYTPPEASEHHHQQERLPPPQPPLQLQPPPAPPVPLPLLLHLQLHHQLPASPPCSNCTLQPAPLSAASPISLAWPPPQSLALTTCSC